MTRIDEIRQLYEFNRWANHRMLEAAGTLPAEQFTRDLGSSFPSVRDTLAHMLSAEWIWLARLHGSSPTGGPEGWATSALEQLKRHWADVEREQAAFLAGLAESRLDEVLDYRNTAGKPFREPLWQILRHVVNHSTYHRGQVTTMLRQLGASPPATDLILFFRTLGAIEV